MLTSKCASRHSSVQFLDIRTSKSAPGPSSFLTFWLHKYAFRHSAVQFLRIRTSKIRFSPQRRAIFWHLNFKKCSEALSFLTFSLANLRFATAACNFWCLLSAPTSAPAALTGLLFDWPDTRIIEKTQHFATSLTFGKWDDRFIQPCAIRTKTSCFSFNRFDGLGVLFPLCFCQVLGHECWCST